MIIFFLTIFILTIILLIPTILLQATGADNGVFSSNITAGAFGARSNEILVKFTSWLVTIFIGMALILSIYFIRISTPYSSVDKAINPNTTQSTSVEEEEPIDTSLPLSE